MTDQVERQSERNIAYSDFRKSILWYDPPQLKGFQRVEVGGLVTCVGYLFPGNTLDHLKHVARFFRATPPISSSYALYYNEGELRHVGRVLKYPSIISKWGFVGEVLIHPVDGVPINYGNEVHFRVQTTKSQLLLTIFKRLRAFRETFTYPPII